MLHLNKYTGAVTQFKNLGHKPGGKGSSFSWTNRGVRYSPIDRGECMGFANLGGLGRADLIHTLPVTNRVRCLYCQQYVLPALTLLALRRLGHILTIAEAVVVATTRIRASTPACPLTLQAMVRGHLHRRRLHHRLHHHRRHHLRAARRSLLEPWLIPRHITMLRSRVSLRLPLSMELHTR
jgi:hypothetical protein